MFVAALAQWQPAAHFMTVQQQADLDCLSIAGSIKALSKPLPGHLSADRMLRVFSDRLKRSDPTRDWASLAEPPSSVEYGWFMAEVPTCEARIKEPYRISSHMPEGVRASLWVNADQANLLVQIQDGPRGYRFIVECVRGCIPPTQYTQMIGDAPISLFRTWDGDDLVYSVWAGGSAYRVRVWRVTRARVTQVLEASSRARPDFMTSTDGSPEVRTYEADGGVDIPSPVVWEYHGGTFSRASGKVR